MNVHLKGRREFWFACVSIILAMVVTGCTSRQVERPVANIVVADNAVNINTATIAELEALPGIGETLAKRIVEYRDKNGKFRRSEHLMLVTGVSERRFRQIRNRVRTD